MLRFAVFFLLSGRLAAGDYTGDYRPQSHFSPLSGWMNDPNGLFYDEEGDWHLYYQHNPDAPEGGNQHWGHATSKDLYHWENQAIALEPTAELGTMWSGCAVIDTNNTSGFFPDQSNGMVAVYTAATSDGQKQALAFSKDNGYTFTQYEGNPILSYTSGDFRDPKVLWHPDTSKWVMLVSYASERTLAFYTSDNLKDWERVSTWAYSGKGGGALECPNFSPVPFIPEGSDTATGLVWLLWVASTEGNPAGGSLVEYYVGSFDGTSFTAFGDARIVEFGTDIYGGQLYNVDTLSETWKQKGAPGFHWATNLLYAGNSPTGPAEGWRHIQTLPRVYHITNSSYVDEDFALVAEPQDMMPITGQLLANTSNMILEGNRLEAKSLELESSAGTFLLRLRLYNLTGDSTGARLNITVSDSATAESVTAIQEFDAMNQFTLDRSNTRGEVDTGYEESSICTTSLGVIHEYDLVIVVDRSVWEVFIMKGHRVATQVFYVSEGTMMDTLTATSSGFAEGVHIEAEVLQLQSVWA
jgi:beta-fructofuranosidase